MTCVLLVTKSDKAHSFGLREAREVGDRNADQTKNRVDIVCFECIDDEVETVRRLLCVLFSGFLSTSAMTSPPWPGVVWRLVIYNIPNTILVNGFLQALQVPSGVAALQKLARALCLKGLGA
jgi:hypothetical protein